MQFLVKLIILRLQSCIGLESLMFSSFWSNNNDSSQENSLLEVMRDYYGEGEVGFHFDYQLYFETKND